MTEPLKLSAKVLGTTFSDRVAKMTVVERTDVATDVVSLVLADPEGNKVPRWTPGAHIEVVLDDVVRQYSLCGEVADRESWRIAVLREQHGRGGSAAIHENLQVGSMVEIRGPRNHFILEPAEEYIFIAGGIGITPITPMLAEAAENGVPWHLYYGGRSLSSMAFASSLASRYPEQVTLVPEDEQGRLDLGAILQSPRPGALVYACGPEGLLQAIEEAGRQWPVGSLRMERFASRASSFDAASDVAFEVVADESNVTVIVEPGQSILHVLDEAGVLVHSSCEEGICGTCETRVVSGTPDHRDSVLNDLERERGEVMMICCSRSLTDRLVLDL
ncbi:PDR/VanB family oxidoreductase [Nocardioides sp. LHG3406-4]|uniref:PDR/VanB family oxidoreductase n=1 Tax=Nocardioides sp. LHG3406-4 TaxID=2804575 RepID=UPI003CEA61E9